MNNFKEIMGKVLSKVRMETPTTRLVFKVYDTEDARNSGEPNREIKLIPGSAEWEDYRYTLRDGTDELDLPSEAEPLTATGVTDVVVITDEGDYFPIYIQTCGGQPQPWLSDISTFLGEEIA